MSKEASLESSHSFFGFDGDVFYIQPVQHTGGLTVGQVLRGLPGVVAVEHQEAR